MAGGGTAKSGLEDASVLDAFAFDSRSDRLILAMFETRPWSGSDVQGFQLQEKLNAYASFILDGEMAEQFADYEGKRVCIQLRTVHEPPDSVLVFLKQVREQLAFQEIDLETVLISEPESGSGCACGSSDPCGG